MPRIYDSGNDPRDYCKDCYPTEATAERLFGDVSKTGEGPDGRGNCFGYDAEHPDYDDTDYKCVRCGQKLDWQDN